MKYKIYAIKDTKIGFMTPIYYPNDAVALRDVTNAANSKEKNAVSENIEDKELWKLGEFDDQSGEITNDIEFILRAIDLKKGE